MVAEKDNAKNCPEQSAEHCNETLCAQIVRETPSAIFLVDADGRLRLANPACAALFGKTVNELVGCTQGELKRSKTARLLYEQNAKVFETGVTQTFEFITLTANGLRTFLLTKGLLRDEDQNVIGLFGIGRDITDRQVVEREILDTIDKEKQRLGRELRENFCQHLVGISLLGNVLYEELERAGRLEQAEFARQIASLVKEVVSEVRNLEKGLSVTHLEQGEGLLEALEDLAEQARSVGQIECYFRALVSKKPVEPQTAMYLFRIAQEAVHNALAHSQASRVLIRLSIKRDTVVLSVRDDGVGFSEKELRSYNMPSRIGFPIMHHRSRAIGAKLEIKHLRRGGIEVICTVPQRKSPRRRN